MTVDIYVELYAGEDERLVTQVRYEGFHVSVLPPIGTEIWLTAQQEKEEWLHALAVDGYRLRPDHKNPTCENELWELVVYQTFENEDGLTKVIAGLLVMGFRPVSRMKDIGDLPE